MYIHKIICICKNSCSKTLCKVYVMTTVLIALVQKCWELSGRVWFTPLYITTIVADLIKYKLSAVASPLCHGDPNRPHTRHPRVRSTRCCARHSWRWLRADGWEHDLSAGGCILHVHTKQPLRLPGLPDFARLSILFPKGSRENANAKSSPKLPKLSKSYPNLQPVKNMKPLEMLELSHFLKRMSMGRWVDGSMGRWIDGICYCMLLPSLLQCWKTSTRGLSGNLLL